MLESKVGPTNILASSSCQSEIHVGIPIFVIVLPIVETLIAQSASYEDRGIALCEYRPVGKPLLQDILRLLRRVASSKSHCHIL
jgi:hypothetical protein